MKDFDAFEQQFIELVAEFQSINDSENRLKDALRAEATRAEAAEAGREGAERAAAEARSSATAAAASAQQAAATLAKTQDELTGLKMQLDLVERQRTLLEERCTDMSGQLSSLERELEHLRPLQLTQAALQRQYVELQERICLATENARKEAARLETELRRVEKCASGGSEIRERARLAAAAHARERRLAAADLAHSAKELLCANSEIARLRIQVGEMQYRLSANAVDSKSSSSEVEVCELRAALEAERAGASRLERALAAALADNAALAAGARAADAAAPARVCPTPPDARASPSKMCPIDSFLAD